MIMFAKSAAVSLIAASLGLSACTTYNGTPNQQATGAVIGAVTGAAAGQAIGGDREATAIGGVIGAVIGGAIGAQLDAQERDLRAALAGTGAEVRNTGSDLRVILPEAVTFRSGSAAVDPGFLSVLGRVSDSLQRHPGSTVRVWGHTDNVGTADYNLQLSQDRAMAVARVLIANGTPASRIAVSGRGYYEPIASNQTAEGRAQNRRVEIVITPTN
jgi:outer membrane protein OmpA-like peptidoglycan-associated protein